MVSEENKLKNESRIKYHFTINDFKNCVETCRLDNLPVDAFTTLMNLMSYALNGIRMTYGNDWFYENEGDLKSQYWALVIPTMKYVVEHYEEGRGQIEAYFNLIILHDIQSSVNSEIKYTQKTCPLSQCPKTYDDNGREFDFMNDKDSNYSSYDSMVENVPVTSTTGRNCERYKTDEPIVRNPVKNKKAILIDDPFGIQKSIWGIK